MWQRSEWFTCLPPLRGLSCSADFRLTLVYDFFKSISICRGCIMKKLLLNVSNEVNRSIFSNVLNDGWHVSNPGGLFQFSVEETLKQCSVPPSLVETVFAEHFNRRIKHVNFNLRTKRFNNSHYRQRSEAIGKISALCCALKPRMPSLFLRCVKLCYSGDCVI